MQDVRRTQKASDKQTFQSRIKETCLFPFFYPLNFACKLDFDISNLFVHGGGWMKWECCSVVTKHFLVKGIGLNLIGCNI